MKDSCVTIKSEVKTKLARWRSIESKWLKLGLIAMFLTLVSLKVFTTVLTFDWLVGMYS